MDKVSIITPIYNSSKFLRETIHCVLRQTYTNWELIGVDDKSSDESVSIFKEFSDKDSRFILVENSERSGPAITRNKAIEVSNGRYIAFLDSDDIWFENKLAVHIEYMKKNNAYFTYSMYNFIDENGKLLEKSTQEVSRSPLTYRMALKSYEIGCLTVVCDAQRVEEILMPMIKKRQDYACWLSILRQGVDAYPIRQILASYRIHSNSISSNKWSVVYYTWLVYYRVERLGVFKSCYYLSCWALNGIRKYYIN